MSVGCMRSCGLLGCCDLKTQRNTSVSRHTYLRIESDTNFTVNLLCVPEARRIPIFLRASQGQVRAVVSARLRLSGSRHGAVAE